MLLDAAERDVEAIRFMCGSEETSDEIFGFHVQRATEKSFKAWLALLGEMNPLTHNLEALGDLLGARVVDLTTFRVLAVYTRYAV